MAWATHMRFDVRSVSPATGCFRLAVATLGCKSRYHSCVMCTERCGDSIETQGKGIGKTETKECSTYIQNVI